VLPNQTQTRSLYAVAQREADESAHAAEQAQVEAAELLNNLQVKDMEIVAAEAARDDALRQARSVHIEERLAGILSHAWDDHLGIHRVV